MSSWTYCMVPCWTLGQLSPPPYPHPPSLLTVHQVSADINIIGLQLKFPIPAKTVLLLFNTLQVSNDRHFGLSRESLAQGRKGVSGPI